MKQPLKLAGLCLFSLVAMLLITNPQSLPSFVLIIPFVIVFIVLLLAFVAILRTYEVSKSKVLRLAVFGTSLPTLLLVLQSLGQLTLRDVLTIFVLFCIAYFYMTRLVRDVNT